MHESPRSASLLGTLVGALALFAIVAIPALVCLALARWWLLVPEAAWRPLGALSLVAACAIAAIAVLRGCFDPPRRSDLSGPRR